MSKPIPEIRPKFTDGSLCVCDGLIICFFMLRPHAEVAHAILHSLNAYCDTVGRQNLHGYFDAEGDLRPLTEEAWEQECNRLAQTEGAYGCGVEFVGALKTPDMYHFEYRGHSVDNPELGCDPNRASSVAFWLPTEYLERHGPPHVRELAVTLAGTLPISSGYVSPAFNYYESYELPAFRVIRKWCFQYPGLDIHEVTWTALHIGMRVRGAYWLNFFGSELLERLGGPAGLRERLTSPEISIQELPGERVLLSLGEWPESGDTERGADMRLYRELARVLEPYLFYGPHRWSSFTSEEMRRWERRFLD